MASVSNSLPSRTIAVVIQHVAPYMASLYREVTKCLAARNIHFHVIAGTIHVRGRSFGIPDDWMHGFDFEYLNLMDFPTPSKSRVVLIPDHRLLKALLKNNPSLVWVHERNPMALASSIWARIYGRKSIISTDVGDNPPGYATSTLHRRYHQWVKGIYHGTIAMTQEAYLAANPEDLPRILIPHAVSTMEFSPPMNRTPSDVFRFIFVGSLDKRKGVDSLIAAASALWRERQDFEVRIVGGGPLEDRLTSNSEGWISKAGHLPSSVVRLEYDRANAFILPSRQDTYAVVVHEAAACGLPILIGSGAGASQVLLDEGRNGFLINAGDPPSITEAMNWMLDHRDEMTSMSSAARKTAVQFGSESNAERLATWLCEILAASHPEK